MSAREAVASWQGRIEVTAPGSRVLARAEPFRLRGVQHALDPPAYAGPIDALCSLGCQSFDDGALADLGDDQVVVGLYYGVDRDWLLSSERGTNCGTDDYANPYAFEFAG